MFEQARLFLYRVLPWAPLGDPTAFVNIHWTFQGPNYKKPAWSGRACISIDECIRTIQWAQRQPDTKDFYACMSTQRTFEERATRAGGTIRIAHREQKNVVQIRVLYLDIDVKDGHHKDGYADLREALTAFFKFIRDSGLLPPTMLVTTGSGGLHVYWVLDAALDRETWQPLAQALAEATRRYGLKCDSGVTVDSARVMRIPETKHSKHGKLAQLAVQHMLPYDYSLNQMRHALAPYMGAQVIPLNPRGNNALPGVNSDLAGGIETPKAPLINLRSVSNAGCGFIREALDTGGAAYANPLWNLTTLAATFSEGQRVDAHTMAAGHPTYVPQETDDLFDRKLREKEEKDLGWPTCQAVENAGCTHCKTCPLKGPNTKPLQFGRPTPVSPPSTADPELPHGYSHNKQGRIQRVKVDKDGISTIIQVAPYEINTPWIEQSPWSFNFMAKIHDDDRLTHFKVSNAEMNGGEKFSVTIGDQGMVLHGDEVKELRSFLVSWQQKLRQMKDKIVTAQPLGWSRNSHGKIEGFSYAGRVFTKDGERPASKADPLIQEQYTPRGDLQPWIDAAKVVTDLHTPQRDVYLAAAFAAPLVRCSGHSGLILAGYSSLSARGKSTALKIAQAVWAPTYAHGGLWDTSNQVMGKMSKLNSLPYFWDEIKGTDQGESFAQLAFAIIGGNEKGRMAADLSLRKIGHWETMLIAATNESVVEQITRVQKTSNAGIYRLFEFNVPELDPASLRLSNTEVDQMLARLNENFGQAGMMYAKFLGENVERVDREVPELRMQIEKDWIAENEERFWTNAVACLIMGAKYANELGLTEIDVPTLTEFLHETYMYLRGEAKGSPVDMSKTANVANVLQSYLTEMRTRRMLHTDRMHLGRGKPTAGNPVKILGGDASKLEDIRVHYAEHMNIMRIDAGHFRQWLQDKNYSPHAIISALRKQFHIKDTNAIMAGGTQWKAQFPTILFELDTSHPTIAKLMGS